MGVGGILNWSFIDAGLCDEVSLVVAPTIDGQPDSARLFDSRFNGDPRPIGFKLKSAKVLDGGGLCVRYLPEHQA
ncbi:dihydrofolate reductase family protein [Bifidobacterium aemilianum]|uniref:dihydrofolate reductase family protein n=1 Tax=Bifidobacterium aemilianum TaxID=2493120 RepID=UPI0038B38E7E